MRNPCSYFATSQQLLAFTFYECFTSPPPVLVQYYRMLLNQYPANVRLLSSAAARPFINPYCQDDDRPDYSLLPKR